MRISALRAAALARACARFLLADAPTPHPRRTLAPRAAPGMVARAAAGLRPGGGGSRVAWDRLGLCWSRHERPAWGKPR